MCTCWSAKETADMEDVVKKVCDANVDQDELAYRKLVDKTGPTLQNGDASIEELYAHFGLARDSFLSRQTVTKHLYAQIAAEINSSPQGPNDRESLRTLKNQILLRHYVEGERLQPYLELLDIVLDATRDCKYVHPLTNGRFRV